MRPTYAISGWMVLVLFAGTCISGCGRSTQPTKVPSKFIINLEVQKLGNGEAAIVPIDALMINENREAFLDKTSRIINDKTFDFKTPFLLVYKKDYNYYVISHNQNMFEITPGCDSNSWECSSRIKKFVIILKDDHEKVAASCLEGNIKPIQAVFNEDTDIKVKLVAKN